MKITSPEVINADIGKVLVSVGACKSRTQANNLIKQGAVEINGEKVGRIASICDGYILHCGKRFWAKLRNTDTIRVDVVEHPDCVEIKVNV